MLPIRSQLCRPSKSTGAAAMGPSSQMGQSQQAPPFHCAMINVRTQFVYNGAARDSMDVPKAEATD